MEANRSDVENEGSQPPEETLAAQGVNELEEPGTSASVIQSQSGQSHGESINLAWLQNPTEPLAPATNTTIDQMEEREPTPTIEQHGIYPEQGRLRSPFDYLSEMVGRLPPPRRQNDWNLPQNPTSTGSESYFIVPPQREVRSEQPTLPPFGFRPPLPRDWPRAPRVPRALRSDTPPELLGVQGRGYNPTEPSRMHSRHPWERSTTRYQYGVDCPWGCSNRCGHEASARGYARTFPTTPARIVRPHVESDPYRRLPPWRREERPPMPSSELPPPRSISVPEPRRYAGPPPEATRPNILRPEELQTNAPQPEGRLMAERSSSDIRQPIQAGVGVQQMDILYPQNQRMEVPHLGEQLTEGSLFERRRTEVARPEAPRMEVPQTQRRFEVSFTTSEIPQLEVQLPQSRRMIISVPLTGETEEQHSEESHPDRRRIELRRPVLGQLNDMRSERQIRLASRFLGRRTVAPRLVGRRIVGRPSEFRQLEPHSEEPTTEETRSQGQRMEVSQVAQAEVCHHMEQRAEEPRQEGRPMELRCPELQQSGLLQPQGPRAEEPRQERRQMELICPELLQSGVLQPQGQRAEEPRQEGRQTELISPELQQSLVLQPQGQRAEDLPSQEVQQTELFHPTVQRTKPSSGSWRVREPDSETRRPDLPGQFEWQKYEWRKSKSQQLRRQAQIRQAQIRQDQRSEPRQSQTRRQRRSGLQVKQPVQQATKATEVAKTNEVESVPALEFFDARSSATDSVTEDEYASATDASLANSTVSTARLEEEINIVEAPTAGSEPSLENVQPATQSVPGFAATSSTGLSSTTSQIDLSSVDAADSDESL